MTKPTKAPYSIERGQGLEDECYLKITVGDRSRLFPLGEINGDRGAVLKFLGEAGLSMADKSARAALMGALASIPERSTFRASTEVGWVDGNFLTPAHLYRRRGSKLVLLCAGPADPSRWKTGGQLDSWKSQIKEICRGNSVPTLLIMSAFVGPLLPLMSASGFGLMLIGEARTGKTTVAKLAGSVCGGRPGNPLAFCESALKTVESLDRVIRRYRHLYLVLDETRLIGFGPTDVGKAISALVFRLATGENKERFTESAPSVAAPFVYVLTSNLSLGQLLSSAGQEYDPAYAARLLSVPVDRKFGAFDRLPAGYTPGQLVRKINKLVEEHYGVALNRYLDRLVEKRNAAAVWLTNFLKKRMAFAKSRLRVNEFRGLDDSTADLFSLIYAAGCLAQKWGILPWTRKKMLRAVRDAFVSHSKHNATDRAKFDHVAAVHKYIWDHHRTFVDCREQLPRLTDEQVEAAPGFMIRNRAGDVEFCIRTTRFQSEFDPRASQILQNLKARGFLRHDANKLVTKRQIRSGGQRERVYCIAGNIEP